MNFAKSILQFVFFACIIKIIVYFIIIKHQPQQIAILQIARSATYAHPHTPLPCTSLRSPSPSSPLCFPPHVTPRKPMFYIGRVRERSIFSTGLKKFKIWILKKFFRKNFHFFENCVGYLLFRRMTFSTVYRETSPNIAAISLGVFPSSFNCRICLSLSVVSWHSFELVYGK